MNTDNEKLIEDIINSLDNATNNGVGHVEVKVNKKLQMSKLQIYQKMMTAMMVLKRS